MTVPDSQIYRTDYEQKFRKSDNEESTDDKFILTDRKYNLQFSHIYYQRLFEIKPQLTELAFKTWENILDPVTNQQVKYSNKVLDVKGGKLSYLIGTIYVSMGGKPSIIDDVKRELWVVNAPPTETYFTGEVEFSVEDDSGRMKLVGDILLKEYLSTGIVVALLGRETASGDFEVQEILKPGLLEQGPLIPSAEPHYVAFVSGLNFDGGETNQTTNLELLKEFLIGGISIDSLPSKDIVKLVVAGNTYAPLKETKDNTVDQDPTDTIDNYFTELCQSIPVDIIPGNNDPTTCALPQQPLHSGLFPKASRFSTLNLLSNPYDAWFGNIRMMGSAGQPIDDLVKCGDQTKSRLGWLEMSLLSRHYAPTSPDTLYCYPYSDRDPFVMDACPHIYFSGNQPEFTTKLLTGPQDQRVCLLTIPNFATTCQVVLVELGSLATSVVTLTGSS